jgi:flavin-dependent dehydrogenase
LPMAWQVRRSQLDEMLFRHAAALGAQTLEGCRVRRVDLDDDGATVQAVMEDGSARQWRTRFVVDASGRDTLMARQLGIKQRNPRHNSSAVFGHFSGATRLAGDKRQGNISIFWFEHGWFWFIPLADGTTSVGATCWPQYLKQRSKPMKEFFFDTIALCPPLAQRLQHATLVDDAVHATGNYTYGATRAAGPRHVLLGDAFAFVDPVFSAGVYLAMESAFKGVEVVNATLDQPRRAAAARRAYEAHVRQGTRVFSWFIFRMTSPALRELFMSQRDPAPGKAAVVSVLAGDVFARGAMRAWLVFFKGIYYVGAALQWRRSWRAWRKRRHDIQDCGAVPGETVLMDPR